MAEQAIDVETPEQRALEAQGWQLTALHASYAEFQATHDLHEARPRGREHPQRNRRHAWMNTHYAKRCTTKHQVSTG